MGMESVYGAMGKRDAAERSGGFDREEWAARKRAEREAAFALADDTALLVNGDGAARAALARVMGRLPGHSATNALLVLAQNPDATRLGDAGYWRRAGARIKKGERAISVIEPTKEFVRQDGTIGVLYDARKVFDVSQTTARPRLPREFAAEEALTALVARSPAPVSPSDAPVPGGARYDPAAGEIMVERGLGAGELFSCLAREACRASMDLRGEPAAGGEAELAAAALGERFGIGGGGALPSPAPEGSDARAVREALSRARRAAAELGGAMARSLEPPSRQDRGGER